MRVRRKIVLWLLPIIACLALVSCRGVAPIDPEVRLQERVTGYIQARQNADLIEMQSYFKNPADARRGNIRYVKSEIAALQLSDDSLTATAKLENDMQVMGFTFKKTPQTIDWEWHEQDWYITVSKGTSNPFNKGPAQKSMQDVNQLKQ